jgi:hypothetical protein
LNRNLSGNDRRAIAVADVNWFTTEHLFREIPVSQADTLELKCIDYNNAWQRGQRPWNWNQPIRPIQPGHWSKEHILPSGWMKKFPKIGMRPIARTIRQWHRSVGPNNNLTLVMTYPHYIYLRDQVKPDQHVYFNVDDYTLYWPRDAAEVTRLEQQLVREADLSVFVSKRRSDLLKEAIPEAAHKIKHLPHGTPRFAISDHPQLTTGPAPDAIKHLPRPFLGYVGTLEDRVDWRLLSQVATRFPNASIVLVGRIDNAEPFGWRADRAACLQLPNVHLLGFQPQDQIHKFNNAFDVCLIPYQVDHPFNEACCPTKIMDYMGSGRPIVSTALPECLLYQSLFDVTDSAEGFCDAVERILDADSDDGRIVARHDWAIEHTCDRVIGRFLDELPSA